ncbi:hypothetical protein AB4114_29105 [Paenibacillus sp. 2RAB27]|uniref:hypothetical protein n=1 Tax=Paenibacillus sp. 2RAB27 TaxID=3232991 RepID=UPI003F9D78FB
MKDRHFNQQAWLQYVEERLPLQEQDEMESHLYQCDECLANYMQCVEQVIAITDMDGEQTTAYVNGIIARTVGMKPAWHRSTMFHYGIAAAATLVLVATGFFHGISQELGTFSAFKPAPPLEAPASLEAQVPISDHLIHKTLTWLDTLQNEHKKGGLEP